MDFGVSTQTREKHRILFLGVLFSVYMFEYMVTLTLIDQGNTGISTPFWQLVLHYADYLLVAAGFVAFGLLRRLFGQESARTRLLIWPNLLYIAGLAALPFLRSSAAYSLMAMLASFCLGVLGGLVYFCMSLALAQTPWMGRVMALGVSAAVLLQYWLQEHLAMMFGLVVVLGVGFSTTLWLAVKKPWAWLGEDCLPYEAESPRSRQDLRRHLLILSLTVVALSLIGTFYDTQMMRLNVQSSYQDFNYYDWPRLFLIAGYGLIGCIGDIQHQRYVPIATLCVALFAVLNPLLFGRLENYRLNMCLYYVCLAANISYFNLMFWNIAQRTRRPELWAGMGRVISSLAEPALAAAHVADLPLGVIVALDLVMFVVLVLLLAAGGCLLIGPEAAPPRRNPPGRSP